MSKEITVRDRGGITILGLLGVVFVTLKLTGYIDWSWWWVPAPFWAGIAIFLAVMAIISLCFGIGALIAGLRR